VRAPLFPGEVVHGDRLAPAGLSAVAALVPAGTRGVAVPSSADTLRLEAGDVVDVLATVVAGTSDDPAGAPTVTVSAGAVVVAVDEGAVTVAVPVEETPQVAYAAVTGIVTLVLVGG
jgi:Flp pilus assembly protein CpaB